MERKVSSEGTAVEDFSSLKEDTENSLRALFAGIDDLALLPHTFSDANLRNSLKDFSKKLANCMDCALHIGRAKIVYGEGNAEAELCFIGDFPSRPDDAAGLPFQAAEGTLLSKMIQAMGYQRENTYLFNLLKCRPPGDRRPEETEINACSPHFFQQLRSLQPKCIVTLGAMSSQHLLRVDTPVAALRGKSYEWEGIKVIPTYHPRELLENAVLKKETWQDLQIAMKYLKEN
jgi:uracil-DNA glycosylase family 4